MADQDVQQADLQTPERFPTASGAMEGPDGQMYWHDIQSKQLGPLTVEELSASNKPKQAAQSPAQKSAGITLDFSKSQPIQQAAPTGQPATLDFSKAQPVSLNDGGSVYDYVRKAVLGPGTAAGTPTSPETSQETGGLYDIFHGNIMRGLKKIGAAESPHIAQGSPIEKLIKHFNPDFKGSMTKEQMEQHDIQYNPINRPTVDVGQFVDKEQHPVLKAIAETASSLTSPGNVAILFGTGGLGLVSSPAKLAMANKLLAAGFTAQAIGSAYKNLEGFKDAYDKGLENEAVYQMTHAILSGSLAVLAERQAIGAETPIAGEIEKKIAGGVKEGVKTAGQFAGGVAEAGTKGIRDFREQRATNKATAEEQTRIDSMREDFKKMAPPTKTAPYSDEEFDNVGRAALEQHHTNVSPIEDVKDVKNAFESARQKIENEVRGTIRTGEHANDPIELNAEDHIREQLQDIGSIKEGYVDDGLKVLDKYPLLKGTPTLGEIDQIREQLNNENRAVQKKNFWSIHDAIATDPEFAARYAFQDLLRDKIYDHLEENGVTGENGKPMREMRRDERSLINLRNAADRQEFKGSSTVRGSGQGGKFRQFGAKASRTVGTVAGAGIGGEIGGPIGAGVGAAAGAAVGETAGRLIAKPDLTRDELTQRMMKGAKKQPEIESEAPPETPGALQAPQTPPIGTPAGGAPPGVGPRQAAIEGAVPKAGLPEWTEGERTSLVNLANDILRNPKATPEDKTWAQTTLDMTKSLPAPENLSLERGKPSTPPERSTGDDKLDQVIKAGGAIPGGMQKGLPEHGIEDMAMFHDPDSGTTLALPKSKVTAETVQKKLADSRAQYAAGQAPTKAAASAKETGGFTFNPKTGEVPKTGFMVKTFPENRQTLDHPPTEDDIRQFVKKNQDILSKHPELHAGGYGNKLNISGRYENQAAAEAAAKKLDQKSIWSNKNQEEILTGGKGEQQSFPDYTTEQRLRDLTGEVSKRPLSDAFVKNIGVTEDPSKTGFILSKGEMISLQGEHDQMVRRGAKLAGVKNLENKEDFINKEGAIRVRFRMTRGGDEAAFSVPEGGVSEEQIRSMKKAVQTLGRDGNIYIERVDVSPETKDSLTRFKKFATANNVEPMLRQIGAHPEGMKPPADLAIEKKALVAPLEIPKEYLPASHDTVAVLNHEWGHVANAHLEGFKPDEILSHNHPDVGPNVSASTKIDYTDLLDSEGMISYDAVKEKIDNFLTMFMGGAAADELFNHVPFTENRGLVGDLRESGKLFRILGYSQVEADAKIAAALDRAKNNLTNLEISAILKQAATSRNPDLPDTHHASREDVQDVLRRIDEVRHGKTNYGNEARPNEVIPEGGGKNVSGRESPGAEAAGRKAAVKAPSQLELSRTPAEPIGFNEDELPYRSKYQDVDFSARDLQDSEKEVTPETILKDYVSKAEQTGTKIPAIYKSYIPMEDLPSAQFGEPEAEFDREEYLRPRVGVPIKVLIRKDGTLEILDGNHRVRIWEEQNQQYAPAWVIDQRPDTKNLSELKLIDKPLKKEYHKTGVKALSTGGK